MDVPSMLKLKKKIFIRGEIVALTGLHIGGTSLGLTIGGANSVVIRNPVDNLPYVPGSSLKGKMRSLLEKCYGLVQITAEKGENKKTVYRGALCVDPEEDVVQLFGSPADTEATCPNTAPTRLAVRDGRLLNPDDLEKFGETDMYCTEIKTEVSIDRLTSAANPRNFERVPAGGKFELGMVVDIYNVDVLASGKDGGKTRAERFIDLIRQGLCLVEDDYLGGQGTRGYGQVCFRVTSVEERTADHYRNGVAVDTASQLIDKFSIFDGSKAADDV